MRVSMIDGSRQCSEGREGVVEVEVVKVVEV